MSQSFSLGSRVLSNASISSIASVDDVPHARHVACDRAVEGGDEAQFWNEGRDFAAHEECCGHAVPSGKMRLKNVVRLLPKPRGSRLWRGLLWVRGGGGKSPDHVKYTAYESQHLIPRLPASARSAPLEVLAAANAPAIIAILAEHLYEADHGMRASEFYARVDRSLEELRATGVDMPSTAREYASQWLAQGLLERTLPYGSDEEVYSLTSASADAVRFVTGMGRPRAEATESRLQLVITALDGLEEDTDADVERREHRLIEEQSRIRRELEAVGRGEVKVLDKDTALERTREILTLFSGLVGDFHRVRDSFEALNA